MHEGAVIVDMARGHRRQLPAHRARQDRGKARGDPLGVTNFPALMPSDASNFFARNVYNFLMQMLDTSDGAFKFKDYFADELTSMTLITHRGKVRFETTKNAKKKKAG